MFCVYKIQAQGQIPRIASAGAAFHTVAQNARRLESSAIYYALFKRAGKHQKNPEPLAGLRTDSILAAQRHFGQGRGASIAASEIAGKVWHAAAHFDLICPRETHPCDCPHSFCDLPCAHGRRFRLLHELPAFNQWEFRPAGINRADKELVARSGDQRDGCRREDFHVRIQRLKMVSHHGAVNGHGWSGCERGLQQSFFWHEPEIRS